MVLFDFKKILSVPSPTQNTSHSSPDNNNNKKALLELKVEWYYIYIFYVKPFHANT